MVNTICCLYWGQIQSRRPTQFVISAIQMIYDCAVGLTRTAVGSCN